MHASSLLQCKLFIDTQLDKNETLSIVDVGSYDVNGTYKELFNNPSWSYTGLDICEGPNVDITVEPYNFLNAKFNRNPDGPSSGTVLSIAKCFDVVISGQCLEHVAKPWLWIQQVASLGKHGSLFWITAPNTWGYHEYPIDCWRIWPDGMRALFDEAGLICIHSYVYEQDTIGIAFKAIPQEETLKGI